MSKALQFFIQTAGLAAVFLPGPAYSASVEYTGKNYSDPFSDSTVISRAASSKDASSQASSQTAVDQSTISSLSIQGLFISANGSMAIVNGKVVRVGDEISGLRVVAVEPTQLRLESKNQKRYNLPYKKRTMK